MAIMPPLIVEVEFIQKQPNCSHAKKLYEYAIQDRADGVAGSYCIARRLKGDNFWLWLQKDGSWSWPCDVIRTLRDFKHFKDWWQDIYCRKVCLELVYRLGAENELKKLNKKRS